MDSIIGPAFSLRTRRRPRTGSSDLEAAEHRTERRGERMGGGDADTFDASEGSTRAGRTTEWPPLGDAHRRAVDDAALGGQLARHAGRRRRGIAVICSAGARRTIGSTA